MIYMDNAATSWPKPPAVTEAMTHFITHIGANPGRSGHRLSIEAARVMYDAREAIAAFFHAPDPLQVVFGHNVTEALNLALLGILRPGQHVITSSIEHNSMMRPLRYLQQQGVELTVVPCTHSGQLQPADVEAAIRDNTVMVALNHASNVAGTLLPIAEVGHIARRHNLLFLVDTAQSAGAYPIDMNAASIDLLAFTGHKGLLGPTGTGGLIIGERVALDDFLPLKRGGTGSHSEHEAQPDFLPDLAESGTPNAAGLAGLTASLNWIQDYGGVEAIRAHERALTQQLIDGLLNIPTVTVYGTHSAEQQTATVSFNIANLQPSQVGQRLDEDFGILCRVGLHCAPSAHRTLKTFPAGTLRFGLSVWHTSDEIEQALQAVRQIAQETTA